MHAIHAPELVILDEPTIGVDPVSRWDFWAILAELLAEEQMTALVSTAYMDEASRFHRVALMHAGQVLAVGRPSELLAHAPGCMVTVHTEAQWPALAALRPQFAQLGALGNALQVYADGGDEAQALAAWTPARARRWRRTAISWKPANPSWKTCSSPCCASAVSACPTARRWSPSPRRARQRRRAGD